MQRTNSSNNTPQKNACITGCKRPGRGFLHMTAELKNINYSEKNTNDLQPDSMEAKGNKLGIAMLCLLGVHRGKVWGN